MSTKKLWISAFMLAGVSLFSHCQAQLPNSNDWTALAIYETYSYGYTDGYGTASLDEGNVKVEATAPSFGDSGYMTADFAAEFIYTPNGGPVQHGPAQLETTQIGSNAGSASGAGWGYSHSDIAHVDGFCPSNYSKSYVVYATDSIDANGGGKRIAFTLYAKAIVANAAEAMATRSRAMMCHKQQTATGSASTSAQASVIKGGT